MHKELIGLTDRAPAWPLLDELQVDKPKATSQIGSGLREISASGEVDDSLMIGAGLVQNAKVVQKGAKNIVYIIQESANQDVALCRSGEETVTVSRADLLGKYELYKEIAEEVYSHPQNITPEIPNPPLIPTST